MQIALLCTYYIVICGLSGCTVFPTLSHKQHDLRGKKNIDHELYVVILSTCSVKYALFFVYFNATNPLNGFSEKTSNQILEKSIQ